MVSVEEVDLSPFSGNGVDITWNPRSAETATYWSKYSPSDGFCFNTAKVKIQDLLTRDFLEATLAKKDNGRLKIRKVQVYALNLGLKNSYFNLIPVAIELF